MKLSRELFVILIIQITEVLGFSLVLPLLPFYAQSLGASPLVVALVLSLFSFCQFLSAPILGRLSDFYGRKPLLIASQMSTMVSFLILGKAGTLIMIFVSRAVDGLLGSNFSIAQAYISDVSTKGDRSKAFGISGMAFGIGFLIGPAVGGFLFRFGLAVPAFTAAAVSFLSILATVFLLPETVNRPVKTKTVRLIDGFTLPKYLFDQKTSSQLWQFCLYSLTHVVWTSNLALYTNKKLGFRAQDIGFILTYVGLVSIFLRGFLLPRLIDRYGEKILQKVSVLAITTGLLGLIAAKDLWWFLPTMSLFAFGNGLARPLMMGNISRSVEDDQQGAVMGAAQSLNSLAQIIGPLIGGYLLTNFFPESLLLASLVFMGWGAVLVWRD